MRDYNRNDRSKGNNRHGGGGRGFGPREMHQAVCDDCGNKCEVPFKPTGSKPIFCSSCFEKKEGREPRGRGRSNFNKPDNTNKLLLDQITTVNVKLDRIIRALESKATSKTVAKKPKRFPPH